MREEYHNHHATAAKSSDEPPHATEQPSISNRPFRYDSLTVEGACPVNGFAFNMGICEMLEKHSSSHPPILTLQL